MVGREVRTCVSILFAFRTQQRYHVDRVRYTNSCFINSIVLHFFYKAVNNMRSLIQ